MIWSSSLKLIIPSVFSLGVSEGFPHVQTDLFHEWCTEEQRESERERERVFRVRNHWISVCAKMVYQCVICMSTQSVVTSPYKGLSACPHAHTLMYLYLFTRTNGLTNHRNWWLSDVIELMRKWPQRSLMSSTFITHPLSCFVPSSLIFHFSHSLASRPL